MSSNSVFWWPVSFCASVSKLRKQLNTHLNQRASSLLTDLKNFYFFTGLTREVGVGHFLFSLCVCQQWARSWMVSLWGYCTRKPPPCLLLLSLSSVRPLTLNTKNRMCSFCSQAVRSNSALKATGVTLLVWLAVDHTLCVCKCVCVCILVCIGRYLEFCVHVLQVCVWL